MILLDTCAIIHASLTPERLGAEAAAQIARGIKNRNLACCDISLWEIAMLIRRGQVKPKAENAVFIKQVVLAYNLSVLPISADIAVLSADDSVFQHKDPCDRIIAATAIQHAIPLITCNSLLHGIPGLVTIW